MNREAVVSEALAWVGTPYHHHGRIRRVGVDCAQLLIAVYGVEGTARAIEPGHYPQDWHLHRTEQLYLHWLQEAGAVEIEGAARQAGDLTVFQFGRTFSHGAILVDEFDTYVHAYVGRGVIASRMCEAPLAGRPCRHFTFPEAS